MESASFVAFVFGCAITVGVSSVIADSSPVLFLVFLRVGFLNTHTGAGSASVVAIKIVRKWKLNL